jgi:hypothetical protein
MGAEMMQALMVIVIIIIIIIAVVVVIVMPARALHGPGVGRHCLQTENLNRGGWKLECELADAWELVGFVNPDARAGSTAHGSVRAWAHNIPYHTIPYRTIPYHNVP